MKRRTLITLLITLFVSACTEQSCARQYGGESDVSIPCGRKLVIATWKDNDLWFLTRAWKDGDQAESYVFNESSSWGLMEGTVNIKECQKTR